MSDLLSGLDPDQRIAASAPRGPVNIIAGAGTGKTRTITHRIAYLIESGFVQPEQILALSYTKRAAGELRERLADMGFPQVVSRTFHSAAYQQLSYFWDRYTGGQVSWKLMSYGEEFDLVKEAIRSTRASSAALGHENAENIKAKDIVQEIKWAKSCLIHADDYPECVKRQHRTCPTDPHRFRAIFRRYEQLKLKPRTHIYLDHADMLIHMAAAIEHDEAIASEFRHRYHTFVVDEYQDITPLQQRLLNAWLGERDDLTVVGDANQTIYTFTGASADFLLDFSTVYPDATTVRLQRDYRSTPEVVQLANDVIGQAHGRIAGTRLTLVGQRPHGPKPVFQSYPDEASEAAGVAEDIRRLIAKGVEPAEIAILYRVGAQSLNFEEALRHAGIHHQVKGGEAFFDRPEIKQALKSIATTARTYAPGEIAPQNVLEAIRVALEEVGYRRNMPDGLTERAKWLNLNALYEYIGTLANADGEEPSLHRIIRQLRDKAADKNPPRVQGVTLMTMHSAKGLEWDAVYLVGLTDRNMPYHLAATGPNAVEAIEEERRLLYVGITRAREHLQLSWHLVGGVDARYAQERSRFLDAVVPEERLTPPVQATGELSPWNVPYNRSVSAKASPFGQERERPLDPELLHALRKCRAEVAAERRITLPSVMTDATIEEIARQLPASKEGLLNIPGLYSAKVDAFGDRLLHIIAAHRAKG